MEYKLNLTDLIDKTILQRMQDAFSKMTGIAVITMNADIEMVVQGSQITDFCRDCHKSGSAAYSQCKQCNKQGAEKAMKERKAVAYTCPMGLVCFAAPIVVQDELLGCFIGGQVLLQEPDPDKIREYALKFEMNPDECIKNGKKIKVLTQKELDSAMDILYTLADILSDITYSRNLLFQANVELGQSVTMKSDFLANMSHEIRTPMNAVIGMAEMALREELPAMAREYVNQIKVAAKSLLAIINDILDFSKIESGKMDIIPMEYEPMSVVHDVANIIVTRLKDKNVELILDIAPDIPNKLKGDHMRIKQIILNLLNNAAKFTETGMVRLKVEYERLSQHEIEMNVMIQDTGIGIKKEDIGKLFQSFSQLDSKRNRNIEGTGLGLAISKQLVSLMHGEINVESEYGKGSIFSFRLPQRIVDESPSTVVKEPEEIYAVGLITNPYIKEHLKTDINALGVEYKELDSMLELYHLPEDKRVYCFIEQNMFTPPIEEFLHEHPKVMMVILVAFQSNYRANIKNLLVIKKPIFILNLVTMFNQEENRVDYDNSGDQDFGFIAPDAQVLIVDDNAVNLTVAEGLLEPLKIKIDTALSGKEAISKISANHYDIVFMDHMMPEMDGVETTRVIRRFYTEYDDVPIIALTANAVDGTKEMFCAEGMNDFIAKPIELRIFISKVKQWLSPEKIQPIYVAQKSSEADKDIKETNIVVGDLDVVYALGILKSEKLFWSVLKEYYRVIDKKVELIKSLEEEENWTDYTIEVHALKSASKQIGAIELSEKAAAMERAGNARDTQRIHKYTEDMLRQYAGYKEILAPYCVDEEEGEGSIPDETLRQCFADLENAAEELDMDQVEEVLQEMGKYRYEDWQADLFARIKELAADYDMDGCVTIVREWESKI